MYAIRSYYDQLHWGTASRAHQRRAGAAIGDGIAGQPGGEIQHAETGAETRGPIQGVLLPIHVALHHVFDIVLIALLVGGIAEEIGADHHQLQQIPIRHGLVVPIEPQQTTGIQIGAAGHRRQGGT